MVILWSQAQAGYPLGYTNGFANPRAAGPREGTSRRKEMGSDSVGDRRDSISQPPVEQDSEYGRDRQDDLEEESTEDSGKDESPEVRGVDPADAAEHAVGPVV